MIPVGPHDPDRIGRVHITRLIGPKTRFSAIQKYGDEYYIISAASLT